MRKIEKSPIMGEVAGLSVPEWSRLAGIGRASFYLLDPKLRPNSVKVGRRTIVIERPAAWLERVYAAGGVSLRKAGKSA